VKNLTFNERDAIQIRIQQIFIERQSLQDEFTTLLSRLREIDERDSGETSIHNGMSGKREHHTSSLECEEFDLGEIEEEKIDTKVYDKRLDELQSFLESESD
jgi:hypothetical protein